MTAHHRSRFHVRAAEEPVVDQGDPSDSTWVAAGGDPRDPAHAPHGIHNDTGGTLEFLWGFDRPRLDSVGIVWDE
ncbi:MULTISPECIES: hypothetical protein [unclassified Pseudonocardia]|uniref:hypothetical protein n=1 Tax=unclassified Pseudonocardia TaxID=2619320 RepID=UPI0001FFE356|nr:hypothetical protein [Pseudonocardia sp. Ae707_Ps1]OLM18663.1 hypothetical protein Ae707Ps1_2922 [Pseudonocardia sp. Ae707_Ps1]